MNKVSARLNNVGFYVKVTIDVTNNATYTPESGLSEGHVISDSLTQSHYGLFRVQPRTWSN